MFMEMRSQTVTSRVTPQQWLESLQASVAPTVRCDRSPPVGAQMPVGFPSVRPSR
jgi:hypothetical protein